MMQPINPFETLSSPQLDVVASAVRKQVENQIQLFGFASDYLKVVLAQIDQIKRDQ